ncbi:UDP-N-acetylmuramate--L-alanine ligase [Aurantibacter sp.]|uniref:UDP-N-acetylmuramate--L-alanine ligase n=1 Tax=Aurantibacter sp. TaxID=2807103 RepID=UPI0035C7E2CB
MSQKQSHTSQIIWSNIYFLGIGGIGMSALARYFHANGKIVAGYDKTKTKLTSELEDLGIKIHYEDSVSNVPMSFLNYDSTLIVYTPAIPKNSREMAYFKNSPYTIMKRSEVLGIITENTYSLAVAGTHGKTTTSTILGHLLRFCNVEMTAFLGGISENYNSNLILNGDKVSVIEADEFDRSFLTLSPDLACITSMDADHLDIYGSKEALHQSFLDFTKKIKPNGKLFVKNGLPIEGLTYGIEDDSDYCANNIAIKDNSYFFDVKTPKETHKGFSFSFPGRHNLSNALVALAMALEHGCSVDKLKLALINFKGVQRRFSYQIKSDDLVYVDDYAHHPEEINAVHQAVREMYPDKEVLVAFQPHLFSRTQDFVEEFAESLSHFDEVLLLDIYPARELPINGVTSKWLLDKIKNKNKKLVQKENLIKEIKASKAKVILTLGAGDIGVEVKSIKGALLNED